MDRFVCWSAAALMAPLFAGCPCQVFDGLDYRISYRSCIGKPDLPVQRSSEWEVTIIDEEDIAVTWTSDDPAVVSATGDSEAVVLRAWEVGTAEVTSVLADGTSDRMRWDVTRATSATLVDIYTEWVAGSLDPPDMDLYGDLPVQPVGDPVRMWQGTSLDLDLRLADADGGAVQWAPSALTSDGSIRVDDTSAVVRLTPDGAGQVFDDVGDTLLSVSVLPVEALDTASIALGVLERARQEPEPDAGSMSIAWLRAVVTDSSDDLIQQAPLVWSVIGAGSVRSQSEGASSDSTGIAQWILEGSELDNWDAARACVVVSLPTDTGTVSRSAWITPEGVELYDNHRCGNRGCACSAVEPTAAPLAVAAFAALAGWVRRRRG